MRTLLTVVSVVAFLAFCTWAFGVVDGSARNSRIAELEAALMQETASHVQHHKEAEEIKNNLDDIKRMLVILYPGDEERIIEMFKSVYPSLPVDSVPVDLVPVPADSVPAEESKK